MLDAQQAVCLINHFSKIHLDSFRLIAAATYMRSRSTTQALYGDFQ